MVFKRDDIYTSSGSTQLFNSWTPYVSKFDTSSFYNWEQDNLPLYDLEERTYEMWEQGGFPTSSVPGLALTVSADTPAATLAADSNIFTDVSSCIASLPKVIRFPVLIEVANMGNMGELELHNFKIEESGSIEIINRAYSPVFDASSNTVGLMTGAGLVNASHTLVKYLEAPDLSTTLFSGISDNLCTSALDISSRVLTGIGDSNVTSVYSFLYPKFTDRRAPLTVSIGMDADFWGPGVSPFGFQLTPYESAGAGGVDAAAFDNTLGTLDVSARNNVTNTGIVRPSWTTGVSAAGSVYLNHLSKISVKNCDGPIYIRNFVVDGEGTVGSGRKVGIEITNSDVVLENCGAVRCKEAGFKFNNSKAMLSRSAFSYRNYDLSSLDGRVPKTGVGFHLVDSDVSLSALLSATTEAGVPGDFQASGTDVTWVASRNYAGFKLENSKLHGGHSRQFILQEKTSSVIASELNTGYGFLLDNSHMDLVGLVDVYGNYAGIKTDNSKITYNNLCVEFHTDAGLRAGNSNIIFDSDQNPLAAGQLARKQVDFGGNSQHIVLDNNSSYGFELKNNMPDAYGNESYLSAHGVISGTENYTPLLPAISVQNNSNAEFIHTKLNCRETDDMLTAFPMFGLGIAATNNSKASFYGTGNGCTAIWGVPVYLAQNQVAGAYAGNNSELNFHGPTAIAQFGVDVLAENGSNINFSPPVYKSHAGYQASAFNLADQANHTSVELNSTRACLVVNKNSTLNMRDLGDYHSFWGKGPIGTALLTAGTDYPTADMNFSSLVGSGSLQFYPNPQDSDIIAENSLASLADNTAAFTLPDIPKFTTETQLNTFIIDDNPLDSGPNFTKREGTSFGGVCVRATEDSVVNVTNVHFPNGNQDTPLDGYYYTANQTDCDKLMIWNIADTSRLNAAFCSVSGMYPADVGYHGPSALYPSALDPDEVQIGPAYDVIASGAPSGTPDTGVLSVLDTFGAGSSVWVIPSGVEVNSRFGRFYPVSGGGNFPNANLNEVVVQRLVAAGINVSSMGTYHYGAPIHTYNNQGVFRIYWSPKANAKLLQNDLSGYRRGAYPNSTSYEFSGVVGPTYHMFAQGYNMSAPVSSILQADGTNVSSLYPDLLKLSYDSDPAGGVIPVADKLWTSGFYYCNEFMDDNPTQCLLDESASNTFANSKNASIGSSGRPKKVTLYRSRSDSDSNRGSAAYPGDTSGTVGFKSADVFDLERDN